MIGYRTTLEKKWAEVHPELKLSGQRLSDQIRSIKNRHAITDAEIENLQRENNRRLTNQLARRSIGAENTEKPQNEDITPWSREPEPEDRCITLMQRYVENDINYKGMAIENIPLFAKIRPNIKTKLVIKAFNRRLKDILDYSENLENTCHIIYCAAKTISELFNKEHEITKVSGWEINQPNIPPWRKRLEEKIAIHRKDIGVIHSYLQESHPSKKAT